MNHNPYNSHQYPHDGYEEYDEERLFNYPGNLPFVGGGQQEPPPFGPPGFPGGQWGPGSGGGGWSPPGGPGSGGGWPPGGPGVGPGGGPGGFPGQGQQQVGPPSAPPPNFTPQQSQFQTFAVDPGGIRGCLFRFTYIWLRRDQFWFYPTFVGRNSIAGFRWRGNRWVYFGIDLDRIQSFQCF
ncbi:hypothetical protein [Oceanobacillus indicireducens]|uniref:Transporter n=1 Tax=Oceanobacillus indicireducens TaxID=1004261 RepID=A0A917XVY6_9BACI|nr:hypothetical protein [Oceanobacillus indicireducens]GGN55730.1 hypothetical protein GCM10007971_14790 [Oceanobacillus indicireducens]